MYISGFSVAKTRFFKSKIVIGNSMFSQRLDIIIFISKQNLHFWGLRIKSCNKFIVSCIFFHVFNFTRCNKKKCTFQYQHIVNISFVIYGIRSYLNVLKCLNMISSALTYDDIHGLAHNDIIVPMKENTKSRIHLINLPIFQFSFQSFSTNIVNLCGWAHVTNIYFRFEIKPKIKTAQINISALFVRFSLSLDFYL